MLLFRTEDEQRRQIRSLEGKIKREKVKAHEAGLTWTKPRPFHPGILERIGAAVCCRHTRRQAVAVSYCTMLKGRVTYCKECLDARA